MIRRLIASLAGIAALVALSASLGLDIVGEGVDAEEQSALLVQLGCHVQQGYLFSRPIPVKEFEEFLRLRPCSRASSAELQA